MVEEVTGVTKARSACGWRPAPRSRRYLCALVAATAVAVALSCDGAERPRRPGGARHQDQPRSRRGLLPVFDHERRGHCVHVGVQRADRRGALHRATAPRRARGWSRTSYPGYESSDPESLTASGGRLFFRCRRRHARARAVDQRRHRSGHEACQGHQPRQRRLGTVRTHRRRRHAVLRRRPTRSTGASCGGATAPKPARSWSRTSTRAAARRYPSHLTNVGGELYFSPATARTRKSCGRATAPKVGPTLVKDIDPSAARKRANSPT